MLFGLRHPTRFSRVLGFSGYYDVHRFLGGYHDEEVHYHNPLDIVRGLQEGQLAQDIRRLDIIMAIGRDDGASATNQALSEALWSKNIWHAMRWWDGWAHDWPYWQQMILHYVNGPD
jgi:esterase/lipase superfamily enzyme